MRLRTTARCIAIVLITSLGCMNACGGSRGLGEPPANFEPGVWYGPIIGDVRPTAATVRWSLAAHHASAIELRAPGAAWRRVDSPVVEREHEVTTEGLLPDTEYEYRLLIGDRPLERVYGFRTAPDDPSAPVRIAVIGDMGCGCAVQLQLIDMIAAREPDLVLLTGDLAYNGGTSGDVYTRFLVPFGDLMSRVPLYATLGNHDVSTQRGEPLLSVMPLPHNDEDGTEQYYAFERGCVRIISINAEFGIEAPGVPQLSWLERTLATPGPAWTFAFAHRPVYSSGAHGDHAALQSNVVPLLDANAVDMFFSGHDHNYQRTHPMQAHIPTIVSGPLVPSSAGTAYIVSGGGGKSLYGVSPDDARFATAESAYHFVLVDVSVDEVRVRPVRLDGSLIEDVRYTRAR